MFGIIGGTGLYKLDEFSVTASKIVDTPFGQPSGPIAIGTLAGREVAFLARHGMQHELLASEVNYRANIWALKSLGVRTILGISAVGSLTAEIKPGDFAIPAQYLDFTKGKRAHTFFGDGVVAHISTAEPVCPALHGALASSLQLDKNSLHFKATYACVEGPRLGTRAESIMLKNLGASLVGMTNVPEAFLAREAQICYATLAIATDYDSWLADPAQHASTPAALETYRNNIKRIHQLLPAILATHVERSGCNCAHSLEFAILSRDEQLSAAQLEMLAVIRS